MCSYSSIHEIFLPTWRGLTSVKSRLPGFRVVAGGVSPPSTAKKTRLLEVAAVVKTVNL